MQSTQTRASSGMSDSVCQGVLATVILLCSCSASAAIDYDLPQDEPSRWSGYIGGGYTRNVYSSDSYNAYESFYMNARLGYRTDYGQYRLTVGGEQETLHGQESTFYDPMFEFRTNKYLINDDWSLTASVAAILPGNHYSKLDHFEYAFRIGGYLYWNPSKDWYLYVSPRYRYNDYKYKTSGQRVLTEHRYDVVADALWQFHPDWYLEMTYQHIWSENYYGRQLDDRFFFAQELGWEVSKNLIVAIAHNNSGRFYNPEKGPSQDFEIFDKRSSTFTFSITQYF
ncbi:hypothetical protein [Ferrimonas aestuarii]|uniref:Outer membrane protein beta-barrel domain-containing protein n=1 Tax=Ferrimonas aestuarii TaxID=2569539 RepID=A0A4U1BKU2_9GAMM|nr:hypothetical protein [Ferrimonas aestuarii]TKB53271.1 hypothetical protein FCL42_14460 [Ferrimonas aestuarii]